MPSPAIELYTTQICPYCIHAKRLLDSKGVDYKEWRVDQQPLLRQEMMQRSGRHTVPQIWIGDKHIGGCDELMLLDHKQQLDPMLEALQATV